MSNPTVSENSVYHIPLRLPKSLEPRRKSLEDALLAAQKHIWDFAVRNGWSEHVKESFAERAEIYDNQKDFIRALLRSTSADPSTRLPKTVSAALENRVFMSVSPLVYERIYPEGVEADSFEKLIAHEMAHRLHIRILEGNEEAMGPVWFFEGFAIYVANQFQDARPTKKKEAWEIAQETKRGSYLKYAGAIRYFLQKNSIHEMVAYAGGKNFLEWLRRSENASDGTDPPFLLTESNKTPAKGTILLIHGSAPFNIDGRVPLAGDFVYNKFDFYKRLATALNIRGWDVVRYSKDGAGPQSVNFDEYKKTDLKAIVHQLRGIWQRMPDDKPKIIFAWSEGTLHASQLPLSEAAAVVLLGAISTNIRDVILAQAESEGDATRVKALLEGIDTMDRYEMLGTDRPAGRLADELHMQDNWRYFEKYDKLPLLILHGRSDSEVPAVQAEIWRTKLPEHNITVLVKPSGNHMYGTTKAADVDDLAGTIHRWLMQTLHGNQARPRRH